MKRGCLHNSHAEFTQLSYGFYSILIRILLNSHTDFTQFSCRFYSILLTKLLNSRNTPK